ncbi:hypothetical protein Tco_0410656 [Tanacetum coccineum]
MSDEAAFYDTQRENMEVHLLGVSYSKPLWLSYVDNNVILFLSASSPNMFCMRLHHNGVFKKSSGRVFNELDDDLKKAAVASTPSCCRRLVLDEGENVQELEINIESDRDEYDSEDGMNDSDDKSDLANVFVDEENIIDEPDVDVSLENDLDVIDNNEFESDTGSEITLFLAQVYLLGWVAAPKWLKGHKQEGERKECISSHDDDSSPKICPWELCLQLRELKACDYKFLSKHILDQVQMNPEIPVKAVQDSSGQTIQSSSVHAKGLKDKEQGKKCN